MNGGVIGGTGGGGPVNQTTASGCYPTSGPVARPLGIIDWWITDRPPGIITGGGNLTVGI